MPVAEPEWLWVVFTLIAAAAQTARNALQRELTGTLGVVGSTHVRFLFGFPFALLALAAVLAATATPLPHPPAGFWPWIILGAFAQILATGLMLAAMGERSFVLVTALIKTEAIQVALFGLVFLGERVSVGMALAILVATAGVVLMSLKSGRMLVPDARAIFVGLASGAMFAFASVGYRAAIVSLALPDYVVAATYALAVGLVVQAAALTCYLLIRQPRTLQAIAVSWKRSAFAGFMGALASQFWFLGFAIATAASVRTLALVEVLFAQALSFYLFRQSTSLREAIGMGLVVGGVLMLLWLP